MNLAEIVKNPELISIDSRTVRKGDIFIAIKGQRFDGRDFVEEALEKGARCAITSGRPKSRYNYRGRIVRVHDTIKTLGDIAHSHRMKFDIPVIAITGTNGKTTAKDMVAHTLAAGYNVLKNETSKNNLIGLPLTLLKLKKKHDVAVLEMGMSRSGEIDRLSEIAKPHIGVITNIGPSHLEFLGTLKDVFMAKSELLKRLSRDDLAILNKDDAFLRGIKALKCKKIYFGIEKTCDFQAKDLAYKENKWVFSVSEGECFESPLLGRHNIYNALVAIVLGKHFNIDFSAIRKRIESFRQTSPMRLEFKDIRGVEVLDDSYNSNPFSMECAIDALVKYKTDGKRIIVSGDMLELGKRAKAMHAALGRIIASSNIDILITLGRLSELTHKGAKEKPGQKSLFHAGSHRDAAGLLKKVARPGDAVLVKGSRAMQMERVIEEFIGKVS